MTEYKIQKGKQIIHFEGELLGRHSNYSIGKSRWTDIEIYKTTGNMYLVVTYGHTTKEDEKQKVKITEASDPRGVIEALKRPGKYSTSYLTLGAEKVAQDAAEKDEGLYDAFYNREIT